LKQECGGKTTKKAGMKRGGMTAQTNLAKAWLLGSHQKVLRMLLRFDEKTLLFDQ